MVQIYTLVTEMTLSQRINSYHESFPMDLGTWAPLDRLLLLTCKPVNIIFYKEA